MFGVQWAAEPLPSDSSCQTPYVGKRTTLRGSSPQGAPEEACGGPFLLFFGLLLPRVARLLFWLAVGGLPDYPRCLGKSGCSVFGSNFL